MAQQAGWRIDVNQCISCRSCETACQAEYGIQAGQGRRRRVIERTRIESGVTRTYFVSVSCHHCKHPACKAACPMSKKLDAAGEVVSTDTPYVSALYKDVGGTYTGSKTAGVVLHNPARCIGCRRCEWACPYGAPQYDHVSRKVHKCELCWQRVNNTALAASRQTTACDATCLGGSINFVPADASGTEYEIDATGALTAGSEDTTGAHHMTLASIDPDTTDGAQWARAGSTPSAAGYSEGRGSSESASHTLTSPAIRFRTRVYKTRAGGVE